jgi:hypothetical protein
MPLALARGAPALGATRFALERRERARRAGATRRDATPRAMGGDGRDARGAIAR